MSNFFVEKKEHDGLTECWIKYEDGSDRGMACRLPEIFADEFANLQKLVRAQEKVSAIETTIEGELSKKGEILMKRIKDYRQRIHGDGAQGAINATQAIQEMVAELYGLQAY